MPKASIIESIPLSEKLDMGNESREFDAILNKINSSRRWLKNTLLAVGALVGLAGATMATGYIYFNSEHYKISRLNPKELERIRWRASWVNHGIDDPCEIMRKEKDDVSMMKWKCHDFLDPPSLEDLPAPLPDESTIKTPKTKPVDSGAKSNNPPKRRVKEIYET